MFLLLEYPFTKLLAKLTTLCTTISLNHDKTATAQLLKINVN